MTTPRPEPPKPPAPPRVNNLGVPVVARPKPLNWLERKINGLFSGGNPQ